VPREANYPVPDRLNGFQARRHVVRQRTPLNGQMGGTQDTATTYEPAPRGNRTSRSPNLRAYNPANAGANVSGGVGVLEAEFLAALVILGMLMFTSGDTYENKIMSFMKRGSLMCALFFALALISSAGVNASRIAKAFGALVIVAILLTSPMQTVITDVDNLIKNDWVGSSEQGNDVAPASADAGTASSSNGTIDNAAQDFINSLEQSQSSLSQITGLSPSQLGIVSQVQNSISSLLKGIGL
jgi:hypothetical protein